MLADGALQDSHSVSMDDAYAVYGRERGGIEEFIKLFDSLFGVLADDVQFPVAYIPARAGFDAHILGKARRLRRLRDDLRHIFTRHLHSQKTRFYFQQPVLEN